MSDYRVEIKVRNGRILRRMNALGIFTVSELCRRSGISNQAGVGSIINLKELPHTTWGEWRPIVMKIAAALNCSPEDMFSPEQEVMRLESNSSYMEVTSAELSNVLEQSRSRALPADEKIEQEEIYGALEEMIEVLPQREKTIIRGHFGLDGEKKTLDDLAATFGVTRERIRQIEHRALRRLQESTDKIRDLANAGETMAHRALHS